MAIDTSNISFINYLWTKKNSDGTLTGIRLSKDNLPEYLANPIPILAGNNISITPTNAGLKISAAADGTVKTVNTISPDPNGNVTVPIPTAGTTASAVSTTASGGNATTWSKSDHVHNISLATGDNNGQVKIAGTNVSVKGLGSAAYTTSTAYATSGHTHSFNQITSRGEAFLDWGGKNFSGSYGPIDAAMVPELGANRLAFMPANAVTIEYSRDGGSTWTDYGPNDSQKINLFNGLGSSFTIGKATSGAGNIATNKYQLRVNIYTSAGSVYTVLNKFVIYLSTSGTNNNWCTIRARKQSDYTANKDTWTTFADKIGVSGWSGYNVINTSGITTYGNTASTQYGHIQFIFGCDTGSTNNSYAGLNINKIFGFGGVGWTTPSTMAKTGRMYTYDSSQNVTFPEGVSAKSFTENGKTLSATYITKSLLTTKGDMIYASGPSTPTRLGIGSNGQFLSIANGIPKWVDNPNSDTHYVNYLQIKGNGTEAVKFEQNANKTLNLKPGNNVSISAASGEITISSTDTNTWRPLGTGASDACAGNDPRLSNARTPTAHTHTSNDITDALTLIAGNNITLTQTASGLKISAAVDGKIKTVNNQEPDPNGNVQLTAANVGALPIDNAADSLNINKELACGSNGKICVGKFGVYDSNITLNVSSTTSNTYSGTIVIATQNGIICNAKVYGDATKALSNILYIAQESYSSNRGVVGVYLNLAGWSKNKIDIRCLKLDKTILNTYYTNLMTSITAMPTYSEGAPNTATSEPKKYTGTTNDIFGAIPTSLKNPKALTFGSKTYDGSSAQTITASDLGALTSHQDISGKQDTLVSGTNIKTINGNSILGSGDLTISGGGGSISVATYSTLGGIKPWCSTTGASTYNGTNSYTTSPAINSATTTSGRFYPICTDKNGRAYVNVPWTNTTYSNIAVMSSGGSSNGNGSSASYLYSILTNNSSTSHKLKIFCRRITDAFNSTTPHSISFTNVSFDKVPYVAIGVYGTNSYTINNVNVYDVTTTGCNYRATSNNGAAGSAFYIIAIQPN